MLALLGHQHRSFFGSAWLCKLFDVKSEYKPLEGPVVGSNNLNFEFHLICFTKAGCFFCDAFVAFGLVELAVSHGYSMYIYWSYGTAIYLENSLAEAIGA